MCIRIKFAALFLKTLSYFNITKMIIRFFSLSKQQGFRKEPKTKRKQITQSDDLLSFNIFPISRRCLTPSKIKILNSNLFATTTINFQLRYINAILNGPFSNVFSASDFFNVAIIDDNLLNAFAI